MVKALHYKLAGRGFDLRLVSLEFLGHIILPVALNLIKSMFCYRSFVPKEGCLTIPFSCLRVSKCHPSSGEQNLHCVPEQLIDRTELN